ncbi:2-hydroxyacid dehydrogenase [Robbsia sp. Bb-Pol-6]|uniref:2-hydroxyacid dehydrogenase n=1 Tax=Robbsia betulipollinis TaxID=2981849 RepID=A0ABT3ZKI3_9BURK|nr:2-hydroxyacid dehydrogenase [Robbsia betulipollinis]MCY0387043.1 2-hydroxyacid dehydrogenase [Robbsia betulipollinis]
MTASSAPRRLKILIAGPLTPRVMHALDAAHETARLWTQPDRAAFLAEQGAQFEVLATGGAYATDAALIAALPALRLVASFGVGVDAIDLDAAKAHDVAVTNTPGVLNDCVADYALGLLLALSRRIVEGDRFVREGRWRQTKLPLGAKLGGKVCGVVGMGGIGRAIARRAEAFGMQVVYFGPNRKHDLPYPYFDSLPAMAEAADVLMLSLPGGAATHHIVDAGVLAALGPRGLLVNVARGGVVDQDALIAALAKRTIAGAALDVFADEPSVPDAMLALDNVVLSPHTASGTHETRAAMGDLLLANIAAFARGDALETPVV